MAQKSFPPTNIRLAPVADFTGGLNLRADAFQLGANESPDMLDVDVQIGGGFIQRRVVVPYGGTGLPGVVTNLFRFSTTAGVNMVIAQCGASLYKSTGGNWTQIGGALASAGKSRAVTFNDTWYFVNNATNPSYRYDGTTITAMGTAFNNVIGGEGAHDSNMPLSKLICVHESRVFIANTVESAVAFPNRIRWSHPGFPEDWRAQDFIDIDIGHDGDVITAIVPFRGRLYIFKQQSLYELVGYGPENFQVVNVANDIGCVSQEATCVTEVGMFFFSYPQGVYLDKGSGPYPIFDKLWPMIRDGFIPQAQVSSINMGWVNRLLWMGIPYNGPSTLPAPSIMSVSQGGTPGSTSYSYVVTALNGSGETVGSKQVTTALGNATLSGSNFNTITWSAITGATGYKVYGRVAGSLQVISTLGAVTTFNDTGTSLSGSGPPTVNTAAIASSFRTLVYNPWIYRHRYLRYLEGPWYPYSLPIGALLEANQPGGALLHLAANCQVAAVGQLEQSGQVDLWAPLGQVQTVPSYYTTRWMDVGSPSVFKRWRHPDFVMRAGTTAQIRVDVKKNYDPTVLAKTYFVGQSTFATGLIWDDGSNTIGGKWDDGSGNLGGTWSGLPTTQELIVRGASMGSARAVQMTFTGPANSSWGIDAFTLKYIPKRVRG